MGAPAATGPKPSRTSTQQHCAGSATALGFSEPPAPSSGSNVINVEGFFPLLRIGERGLAHSRQAATSVSLSLQIHAVPQEVRLGEGAGASRQSTGGAGTGPTYNLKTFFGELC